MNQLWHISVYIQEFNWIEQIVFCSFVGWLSMKKALRTQYGHDKTTTNKCVTTTATATTNKRKIDKINGLKFLSLILWGKVVLLVFSFDINSIQTKCTKPVNIQNLVSFGSVLKFVIRNQHYLILVENRRFMSISFHRINYLIFLFHLIFLYGFSKKNFLISIVVNLLGIFLLQNSVWVNVSWNLASEEIKKWIGTNEISWNWNCGWKNPIK